MLKYRLPKPLGGVQIRGIDIKKKALVKSSHYQYHPHKVNLAVMDIREVPREKGANVTSTLDPFLNFMFKKLEPSMSSPSMWLFILENKDDVFDATNFASSKLDQYEYVLTTYVPSKAEMLNNITTRATAPNVPLLFLFKKNNSFADSCRDLVKTKYNTPPNCLYYLDMTKNTAQGQVEDRGNRTPNGVLFGHPP